MVDPPGLYCVYGLSVRSTLPLPELTPLPAGALSCAEPADITIRVGEVGAAPVDAHCIGPDHWLSGDRVWLRYTASSRMLVQHGCEIVVEADDSADECVTRLAILGGGLGAILHQRGILALHASAVSVGGKAVILLGHSGAGKSTLAAALVSRGHTLLVDDVVAVTVSESGIPTVPSGFSRIKLFPDSVQALAFPSDHLESLPLTGKFDYRAATLLPHSPLPLDALVTIEADEVEAPRLEPLKPSAGLMALIRYSYAANLISKQPSRSHFEHCAAIAQSVPLFRMRRTPSLSDLPTAAELIEGQVIESHQACLRNDLDRSTVRAVCADLSSR